LPDKSDLIDSLRQAVVRDGSLIHVHSSLSSFGHFEGGAQAVIEALEETVSPDGTLSMPALNLVEWDKRRETWDIVNTPSTVGRITEVFRTQPGTLRSDHYSHSCCVRGKLAVEMTRNHTGGGPRISAWGANAFGPESPWQKLYDHSAIIIYLGVDMQCGTIAHLIESLLCEDAVKSVPLERARALRDRIADGKRGGVWPKIDRMKLQGEMEARGLIRHVNCGSCRFLAWQARDMVDLAITVMKQRPEDWFDPEFIQWYYECAEASK